LVCVITRGQTSDYDAAMAVRRERAIEEARQSGNSDLDIAADWVDYQQAGVADAAALGSRIVEVLRLVDLEEDVYLFGLRGRVDPELQPEIAQRIVKARRVLAERLSRDDLGHLVERLASNRYNANSPVSANLLFGTPIGSVFEGDGLARNVYVESVLDRVGLTGDLVEVGTQVARVMVELLAGLRPEHQFFEEVGLISAEDLPVFERILMRIEKTGVEALSPEENVRLVSLGVQAGRRTRPTRPRRRQSAAANLASAPSLRREPSSRIKGLGRILRPGSVQRRRTRATKRAFRYHNSR
jgi:hypothetical protein